MVVAVDGFSRPEAGHVGYREHDLFGLYGCEVVDDETMIMCRDDEKAKARISEYPQATKH